MGLPVFVFLLFFFVILIVGAAVYNKYVVMQTGT